jgi:dTDP-4-amino-4,6-dideoxygalactose transaminase
MASAMDECEKVLARSLGRRHCVLVGRGATALWVAYGLADAARPKVALPAMVCLSPMFTAIYAGRTPVFADVRERDATISPEAVERLLAEDPGVGAVVAVHLYGQPAAMAELEAIGRRRGVLVIEDLAQAHGGADAAGRPFGTFGDLSVVSFGHTKILDLGGGGALLTDDAALAERARAVVARLGDPPEEADRLATLYSRLYYATWECGRADRRFYRVFDLFPELFKPLYLYRATDGMADRIRAALGGLEDEVAHRQELAALYAEGLQGLPGVTLLEPSGPGVPWRFTFRVKAAWRQALLGAIRQAGFDASSWYPGITDWTPSGRAQGRDRFPAAGRLEEEVVNLWVTRAYTAEAVGRLVEVVRSTLRALADGPKAGGPR